MSLIIQHNLSMLNTQNNYKKINGAKAKSTEKLSSGYRINRSADDAAGLSISEKLRIQIRGLDKGVNNAQDGVSWVQTGDSALNEVDAILHRMKELTIQSLNDTNTEQDRVALQSEFDALQSEIDKITATTTFNTKNIFSQHEPTYYSYCGNIVWPQSESHVITDGANTLSVTYRKEASSIPETAEIRIPAGTYTTQELTYEITDALEALGLHDPRVMFEYTKDHTCNINLEGGEMIDSVSGNLSYLLFDIYEGSSVGALVGTTVFVSDTATLDIGSQNNNLSFDIEDFSGNKVRKSITIPDGDYTRDQIIDILNRELAGTSVEAVKYGTGIKLASDDNIITGFKGNMFKIDTGKEIYSSVFYDNVKYGNITNSYGSFVGGAVLTTNSKDIEHSRFNIGSNNNTLRIKANGASDYTNLVIPSGDYTASEMVSKLNSLFNDNNLKLNAVINSSGSFQGITINSTKGGIESIIEIDKNSSAYNTLFTDKSYNSYGQKVNPVSDSRNNTAASVTGGKTFSGGNLPLEIVNGTNDDFTINIDGNSYNVKLSAGVYSSATDVMSAVNDALNGTSAIIAYKDKINVSLANDKIKLTAANGSGISNFSVSAGSTKGYENLFVGLTERYSSTVSSGNGSITLNNGIPDPMVFDSSNNKLNVNVSGNQYTVDFGTGSKTHDEIINIIEQTIPEKEKVTNIEFSTINCSGNTIDKGGNMSGTSGRTDTAGKSFPSTGDSQKKQGETSFEYNIPAKVTVELKSDLYSIDSSNNQIQISINKNTMSFTIPEGTYSKQQLATELQNKINSEFGSYYGGAAVTINSSGNMEITARLKTENGIEKAGRDTEIYMDTSTSSLLKEIYTTRTTGSLLTPDLCNSITIADGSDTLSFSYYKNGVNNPVEIKLAAGTYSKSQIVSEINNKLSKSGAELTASLENGKLKFTTKNAGKGNYISFNTHNSGSATNALFGELITHYPAVAVANQDIQSSITIDDASNKFTIRINGTDKTVTLDNGTYDRNGLVTMLNSKFADEGVGATVSLEENRLKYTTVDKGSSASIYMSYYGGGNSMKAIYGVNRTTIPGVDAEFTPDNKLKLTNTQGGGLSVSSNSGGVFQKPNVIVDRTNPTTVQGYESTQRSYIDGVNINSPVTIDMWNNELNFSYIENGVSTPVNIIVPDGVYDFDSLKNELQQIIDAKTGTGKMNVIVDASGIRIECNNPGNSYKMSNFSGDFYDKVMCQTSEVNTKVNTSSYNGLTRGDVAFTVGRKDVRNNEVKIKTGINDELSLDFTYGGVVHKINMKLDEGIYRGDSLITMIQDKLNGQLKAMNLSENLIEVGIGGVNTGVTGNNDANALNFMLSTKVQVPAEGEYIIDGVSGNAAFSVFYQTDGEMIPAYIKGARDLSDGIEIINGENELSLDVDGTTYSITIPEGIYTQDEIKDVLNNELSSTPVTAEIEDGKLRISYDKLGRHFIDNVNGSAKNNLFYINDGKTSDKEAMYIQLSSVADNKIEISRPILNTSFLGINSAVITRPKYANSALNSIGKALDKVLEVQSDFGAEQNRLEHSIRNNENASENQSNAESSIRDTDMAKEMVELSKQKILEQVTESMMAQAQSMDEGVLMLLK